MPLLSRRCGEDPEPDQVVICIETERGPWMPAPLAAGYQVYAVNPLQAARFTLDSFAGRNLGSTRLESAHE